MKTFDWIVVGNGISGAAVSYELARAGFSVLLLEQSARPQNATRYSYGGVAYWAATTEMARQLCQEGIELHRNLSLELESDTEFQNLDLLLTINPDRDPAQIAANYANCMIPPTVLSPEAAHALEPLLNSGAIAGALHFPHGHVSPEAMVRAYNQAFLRIGGRIQLAQVTNLIQVENRIKGVITPTATYEGDKVLICAGGMSRSLLKASGLSVRIYFTQAELIETPPVDLRLRTIVMPAELKRFEMEAIAGRAETDPLWDEPAHEVTDPILDAGAVQFLDGRLRIGQVSRTHTNPQVQVNATESEAMIRQAIGQILPELKDLPGEWHACLVAFSGDRLPLIGALADTDGPYLFSGFSNPFAILPPLARRFARHVAGETDPIIEQLSPSRFAAITTSQPTP